MPTWIRVEGGQACGADGCPAIHLSEDGRLFIRGRRASGDVRDELALHAEEEIVEIPRSLLDEASEALRQTENEH